MDKILCDMVEQSGSHIHREPFERTKMTYTAELKAAANDLHAITTDVSTHWTPRLIRCKHCGSLAKSSARERIAEDDVAVRYECPECRWAQTRHYHDSDFTHRN